MATFLALAPARLSHRAGMIAECVLDLDFRRVVAGESRMQLRSALGHGLRDGLRSDFVAGEAMRHRFAN